MPIGRGVRARKYKAHYSPAPTTGSTVAAMCHADMAQPLVEVTAASAANHNHHNHGHHRHQSSLVSDEEENTSEYSHRPSTSEHSTLESNPDMSARMHVHGFKKPPPMAVVHGARSTSTSSASSSSESEADSDAVREASCGVRSSLRSRTKHQRAKVNNNKRPPTGSNSSSSKLGNGNGGSHANLADHAEPPIRVQ